MITNFRCFSILLLLFTASSKIFQAQIKVKEIRQSNGSIYLGKMALRVGSIDIKMRTQKIEGETNLHGGQIRIAIIPDDQWTIYSQDKCKKKDSYPLVSHQILYKALSISQHTIKIQKEQLYYFNLIDCNNQLTYENNSTDIAIRVQLEVINSGSFMGEQQDHWLTVPLVIGVGLWIFLTDKHFLKPQFQQDPDYAKMILLGAIATNISSLMWRSFGYLIYLFKGSNYLFFHFVYLFMHSVSQALVIGLLILVALGWSLNYLEGPQLNLAAPIISIASIANIALVVLAQIQNSTHDMHHTFDARAGSFLIWIRIITGVIFLICLCFTVQRSRYRVREFLKKFSFFGFLYLLSMPLIVYIANNFMEAKQRNQFVFISVESIKSICNISLIYMVNSSRSEYNKLSYKNASFLPDQNRLF